MVTKKEGKTMKDKKDGMMGAPECYGIADVAYPGMSKGIEGYDEHNLEPPTSEKMPTGIDNTTGKVTSGPKD